MKNTVIIVLGATASGKTALALQLAKHFNTSIISADSRQCFKELNIGVAKPRMEELNKVKHYFINTHSIVDEVTAAIFENYALEKVDEIFHQNNMAVMAGGSGLYIKAFCEGLDKIPEVPKKIHNDILKRYRESGPGFLQAELKEKDPAFWKLAEQQNPQRLMRALEVLYATGNSILSFRGKKMIHRPFNIIKIGINISKEQLYKHISHRAEMMIQQGLDKEASSLLPDKNRNALQTVGYKELFDFFDGKLSLKQAIEQIKINTRKYAKRQMTWFKKDKEINWIDFDDDIFLNALHTIKLKCN